MIAQFKVKTTGKMFSSLLLLTITLAACMHAVQTSESSYESRSFQMADSLSSQTMEPPMIEWSRTYGTTESADRAFSVVQTNDGEYVLGGYGFANLMKTNGEGNQLWNRSYEGGGWVQSLVQTNEGGYALAGCITPSGDVRTDFWLAETDTDGNMLWNKTYGRYAVRDDAFSLVQASDGGYAIAGVTGMAQTDFWLVRTDAKGNMQWNKTYHRSNVDWPYSIIKTDDGGYAIAGSADPILGNPSHGSDLWLVKTDENGNEEWNKTYGGTGYDIAHCVVQTNDGGYALAGGTASPYGVSIDFWLVKTDSLGELQWDEKYGGTHLEAAMSMVQTLDGGYALAGYVDYWDGGGLTDAYLVKTDSNGIMEWNQIYGEEAGGDKANCIVQTGDGGYAIAGISAHAHQDFWLMKLRSKSVHFWNSGWDFELGEFDTGDHYDEKYMNATWGSEYWGVHGYTWTQGEERGMFPIHYCRFHSDGHVGYLYGWEEYGEWGVVTYVQGDTWNIDPPWNCPQPLATDLKDLTICIDLWRDVSTTYESPNRTMYAINAWFESPYLRNEANNTYKKRLVMDLVFYVDGTISGVQNYTDLDIEDGEVNPDSCYHYQAKIYTDENPTPYRSWKSWTIDLNKHIEGALQTQWHEEWDGPLIPPIANPDEVRRNLTLCQLEFILEVKHAWAGCAVDNFYLAYTLLGDVNSDGVVDASDLSNLAEAYGSTQENPEGNPNCDVNEDGNIDILDLCILGKNYGENS